MKKKSLMGLMTLVLITLVSVSVASCNSDDESVVLEDYVVGSWHSFKCVVTASGKSETFDITKTGENSLLYMEAVAQEGGQIVYRGWEEDSNGLTSWVEERGTYKINNNIVTITNSKGETLSMTFDKDKTLCYKMYSTIYGKTSLISIYFKK